MKDHKNTSRGASVGFGSLLTLLFIALKLTGVIDWGWLWFLSPIWISFLLVIIFVAIIVALSK